MIALNLAFTGVTDGDLARLKDIPTLRSLWLDATNISDNGLKNLYEMSQLREVDLRGTRAAFRPGRPICGFRVVGGAGFGGEIVLQGTRGRTGIVASPVQRRFGADPSADRGRSRQNG